ncbi:MAG: aldo/keto reductase [Acholeplasmataceae bacterium]|nr:aldo/keto reductase [Acholeplasmataceae bacterium]
MNKRVDRRDKAFKGIDQNPSLLGFGCMRFPVLDPEKPDIDEGAAEKMVDVAYAHGINYFDTAYPYHNKTSERFIGKALKKYPRESFYLADKMPSWMIESKEDAKRIFEEQLEKCQVDYFDYYLAHALNRQHIKAYEIPGVMDFLYQMKAEGKIRHLGFSFHDTPEILEKIIHMFDWDFVQIQLNYLDWTFQDAKTQYQIIKDHGVPVIVMEPVRGGLLASLCTESQDIFKAYDKDHSIASWAIRYAASKDNVLTVLSGMSDLMQTEDNIKTMTDFKPITGEEQKVIDEALKVFMDKNTVPCTKCKYCMPCPVGIDIPAVLEIYNNYKITKNKGAFIYRYEKLALDQRPSLCVACGECMTQCPQHIQIPEMMEKVQELYQSLKDET